MPSLQKLAEIVGNKDPNYREKLLTADENRTFLGVHQVCAKCHDIDNDPKFKLEVYWKDIVHTGLKNPKAGGKR